MSLHAFAISGLLVVLGLSSPLAAVDLEAALEVGARSAQGTPLTYSWVTVERPLGSGLPVFSRVDPAIEGATDARKVILVDAQAGLYRFQVRIVDGTTNTIAETEILVRASTSSGGGLGTSGPPPSTVDATGGGSGGGCGQGSSLALLAMLGLGLARRTRTDPRRTC